MTNIPGYSFNDITLIDKGVSGDRKYRVTTSDGCTMLLRVSDISEYDRKSMMYRMMEQVSALGVPMSRPISFGVCDDGNSVFQLLSWCDGDTADAVLPSLPEAEQYELGIKAGGILRIVHSLPAPNGLTDWAERYICKNDDRVRVFQICGVEFDGSDILFSYYKHHYHLLENRPQCFIHGDYHCENLMISDSLDISVIDWDLFDDNIYGDPWYEFVRILNSDVISHFTSGLLRGYFNGEPTAEFWRLLMFYFSAGALQLVAWAALIEPKYLDECKQTAINVIKWYDGMKNDIPSWYIPTYY